MYHRERTIGIRGKRIARCRVESGAVDSIADRYGGDHLAGMIVGNCHDAATASAKESVVGGVDRHRDRLLAGCSRPAPDHGCRLGVDLRHLTDVGQIGIYLAVAGGSAVLRLASQRDVRYQLSCHWIYNRGACLLYTSRCV